MEERAKEINTSLAGVLDEETVNGIIGILWSGGDFAKWKIEKQCAFVLLYANLLDFAMWNKETQISFVLDFCVKAYGIEESVSILL